MQSISHAKQKAKLKHGVDEAGKVRCGTGVLKHSVYKLGEHPIFLLAFSFRLLSSSWSKSTGKRCALVGTIFVTTASTATASSGPVLRTGIIIITASTASCIKHKAVFDKTYATKQKYVLGFWKKKRKNVKKRKSTCTCTCRCRAVEA